MKRIAIDLDGVLSPKRTWQGVAVIPDPFADAAAFVRKLRATCYVILHTCRLTEGDGPFNEKISLTDRRAAVLAWLHEHNIEVDELWQRIGKPSADCYIDDRAVHCAEATFDQAYHAAMSRMGMHHHG